jgi:DNA-binding NtrC family response regulator
LYHPLAAISAWLFRRIQAAAAANAWRLTRAYSRETGNPGRSSQNHSNENSAKRIVVDDDVAVLSAIEDIVKAKTSFLVRIFRTYREAVEMLNTEPVEIIVADVILGGEATGIDACVTAIERHPGVALILISAEAACDYHGYPPRTVCLQKPFSAAELMDAIAQA